MYVCMYAYTDVYTPREHIRMYTPIRDACGMYVFTCVCMYVCMYTCMYIRMYIYIFLPNYFLRIVAHPYSPVEEINIIVYLCVCVWILSLNLR
jgi:hypothetical protein